MSKQRGHWQVLLHTATQIAQVHVAAPRPALCCALLLQHRPVRSIASCAALLQHRALRTHLALLGSALAARRRAPQRSRRPARPARLRPGQPPPRSAMRAPALAGSWQGDQKRNSRRTGGNAAVRTTDRTLQERSDFRRVRLSPSPSAGTQEGSARWGVGLYLTHPPGMATSRPIRARWRRQWAPIPSRSLAAVRRRVGQRPRASRPGARCTPRRRCLAGARAR